MATKIIYLNSQIKNYQSSLPLVIGYFGCIHKKHLELLTKYKKFNILTFQPFKTKLTHELYDFATRLSYLKQFKPTIIYVFSIQNDNLNGKQFIQKYLQKINPKKIVVGSNFCFGKDKSKTNVLKQYFPLDVIKYDKQFATTKIRKLLEKNQIIQANKLLNEPFYVCSKWIKGLSLGHKIGYPTINLVPNYKINLPFGSYLSKIQLGKSIYHSVTFIGKSKTFDRSKLSFETHIIDHKIKPITSFGKKTKNHVKVWLLDYLYKVQKFENVTALKNKIKQTILEAKKRISNHQI